MKSISILLLIISSQLLFSQIVNIPDANFKNALLYTNCVDSDNDGIPDMDADTNNDGEIQVSEAETVVGLFVSQQNISSMEGVQSFVNIEVLDCSSNLFENINVTQNSSLVKYVGFNNINLLSLDFSQNINLTEIICYGNIALNSLDITQVLGLEILNCGGNSLTTLDVSNNLYLNNLECQYGYLNNIDVSNNTNLMYFNCSGDSLLSVDVSNNLNLIELSCDSVDLTSLDISSNTNLEILHCGGGDFNTIDFSQNLNLKGVWCGLSKFTTFDFSQNSNLEWFHCNSSELTELNFSQNPNLVLLSLNSNPLTSLNIQNGNNEILTYFRILGNLDLDCVQVDNEEEAYDYPGWQREPTTYYSVNCELNVYDFNSFEILIFPNPTTNTLNIQTENQLVDSITILNLQGIIIKEISNSTKINISELDTGVYFIQIFSEGDLVTKKFIKK